MTARGVRIAILLMILGFVGFDAWLTRARTTSWDKTLRATLYPIVADGREPTRTYVASLTREDFTDLEVFLRNEAPRYGVTIAEPLSYAWARCSTSCRRCRPRSAACCRRSPGA